MPDQYLMRNFGECSWIRKNSDERGLSVDQSDLLRIQPRIPVHDLDGPQAHPPEPLRNADLRQLLLIKQDEMPFQSLLSVKIGEDERSPSFTGSPAELTMLKTESAESKTISDSGKQVVQEKFPGKSGLVITSTEVRTRLIPEPDSLRME